MTLILSEKEVQTPANVARTDSYELLLNCPQSQSRGHKRSINLRFGLNFVIHNYQLQDFLVEENLPWEHSIYLEFGFNILGKYRNGDATSLSNWQSFLEFGLTPTIVRFREWTAKQRVLKVDIHLTAPSALKTFSCEQLELIMPELRQIVETADQEFCQNLGTPTPATQLVLQQILNCPYQGWTQQIFLEGKALELIALQSTQFFKGGKDKNKFYPLKRSDIDRIYQARDLLIHNLDRPPSLLELAHQVGLNDCTLKRGFRQIFGTTVFGYLRNQRLAQARLLLIEGEMSVAEVACAIGYSHPGYFAAAFKKEFGVNPKSLSRTESQH